MNRLFQSAALCFLGTGNALAGLSINNDQFVINNQQLDFGYDLYIDSTNNLKPWFKISAVVKEGMTELANITLPQNYREDGNSNVTVALNSSINNATNEVTVSLTAENIYWAWCHIDNDVSKGIKPQYTQIGNENAACFARTNAMVRVPRITSAIFPAEIEANQSAPISYTAQAPLGSYVKFLLNTPANQNILENANGNDVVEHINTTTDVTDTLNVTTPSVTPGTTYTWQAKLFTNTGITGPIKSASVSAITSNSPPVLASNIDTQVNRVEAIVFDNLFTDPDGDDLVFSDVNVVFGSWHNGPPPPWFGDVDAGNTRLNILEGAFGNKTNEVVNFTLEVTAMDQNSTPVTVSLAYQLQATPGERIWYHPFFQRTNGESSNFNDMNNTMTTSGDNLYYGLRYELPWSLFETDVNQYYFGELDLVMQNALTHGYKVYLVLHDKTWTDASHNDWPVPLTLGNQAIIQTLTYTAGNPPTSYEINKTTGEQYYITDRWNQSSGKVRTANRWKKNANGDYVSVERYKNAVQEILAKNYPALEVISTGESSTTLENSNITTAMRTSLGYPGASDYAAYQEELAEALSSIVQGSSVKIALNLNWIADQPVPTTPNTWLQNDVLSAVYPLPNGMQAIEDVHAAGASKGAKYHERVYPYTTGNDRVMAAFRVWAQLSCDSKHNGKSASENLAMARSLGSNIVLRASGCDGSSTLQQYVNLLK